jgi:diguanylate cyclase (GGDEF)-like protein
MEESLELELRRAARNQRPLGVIMLEVDHPNARETGGREAEDTVLVELGSLLRNNIRKEDIACRFGGEKFTLILPQGNPDAIRLRAETMRELIGGLDIKSRNGSLGRFTVSLGMAVYPDHGRAVEALLQSAEAALLRAQAGGGNSLEMAD